MADSSGTWRSWRCCHGVIVARPMIRSPTMASTGGGLWVVQTAGMLYDYEEKPNERTSIAPLK